MPQTPLATRQKAAVRAALARGATNAEAAAAGGCSVASVDRIKRAEKARGGGNAASVRRDNLAAVSRATPSPPSPEPDEEAAGGDEDEPSLIDLLDRAPSVVLAMLAFHSAREDRGAAMVALLRAAQHIAVEAQRGDDRGALDTAQVKALAMAEYTTPGLLAWLGEDNPPAP